MHTYLDMWKHIFVTYTNIYNMFHKPPTFEWIIPIKETFLYLVKVIEGEMKICLFGSFSIVLHLKPLSYQSGMIFVVLSGHLESYLGVTLSWTPRDYLNYKYLLEKSDGKTLGLVSSKTSRFACCALRDLQICVYTNYRNIKNVNLDR